MTQKIPIKRKLIILNYFSAWKMAKPQNPCLERAVRLLVLRPKGVELNSECDCSLQKSKKVTWFCVGVNLWWKNDFFFSFWYLGPHRIASKNYGNIFSILFEMENQKNKVKNSGGDRNKVKNSAKVGSREIFFSRFHEIYPDFSA